MLIEDLLLLGLMFVGAIFVIYPLYKFFRNTFKNKNELKIAQEQLEKARIDLEVANLTKKTQLIYDQLIEEEDKDTKQSSIN